MQQWTEKVKSGSDSSRAGELGGEGAAPFVACLCCVRTHQVSSPGEASDFRVYLQEASEAAGKQGTSRIGSSFAGETWRARSGAGGRGRMGPDCTQSPRSNRSGLGKEPMEGLMIATGVWGWGAR